MKEEEEKEHQGKGKGERQVIKAQTIENNDGDNKKQQRKCRVETNEDNRNMRGE